MRATNTVHLTRLSSSTYPKTMRLHIPRLCIARTQPLSMTEWSQPSSRSCRSRWRLTTPFSASSRRGSAFLRVPFSADILLSSRAALKHAASGTHRRNQLTGPKRTKLALGPTRTSVRSPSCTTDSEVCKFCHLVTRPGSTSVRFPDMRFATSEMPSRSSREVSCVQIFTALYPLQESRRSFRVGRLCSSFVPGMT